MEDTEKYFNDQEIPQWLELSQKPTTIKDLKKGEMLTFKKVDDPKPSQVWVRDDYYREDKKYIVYKWDNIGISKLVDGSKQIFTSFTF